MKKYAFIFSLLLASHVYAETEESVTKDKFDKEALARIEKRAHEGHAEEMLKLAEYYAKEGEIKEARKWAMRSFIRSEQDCSCIKDFETYKEITDKVEERYQNLKFIPKKSNDEKEEKCIGYEALEWVSNLKSLPSPHWILQFAEDDRKPEEVFCSKECCELMRRNKIKNYHLQVIPTIVEATIEMANAVRELEDLQIKGIVDIVNEEKMNKLEKMKERIEKSGERIREGMWNSEF